MLALIVGVIMVVGGMARLGFVADLLSKPTMIGYMNGLAVTILVGQLPSCSASRPMRMASWTRHGHSSTASATVKR